MIIKKLFIVIANNTSETMTGQHRHHERNREKCLEKSDRHCFKLIKESLQKWLVINTKHCLKKKIIKDSMVSEYVKRKKIKEYGKQYIQNISEEKKTKKKTFIKEQKKSFKHWVQESVYSNIMLLV